MSDQLTISREDREAILAAVRGIEWTLKNLVVLKEGGNEASLYAVWNNLDLIRLRLIGSGPGKSGTRN